MGVLPCYFLLNVVGVANAVGGAVAAGLPCYFLLNVVLFHLSCSEVFHGRYVLLFSFECCISRRTVGWMQRSCSLLFSFECCPQQQLLPRILRLSPYLAIFF